MVKRLTPRVEHARTSLSTGEALAYGGYIGSALPARVQRRCHRFALRRAPCAGPRVVGCLADNPGANDVSFARTARWGAGTSNLTSELCEGTAGVREYESTNPVTRA